MAKDPAMLWYWGDWHSGTSLLSRFLKGCYMDVLHAQFNNGRLSLEEIKVCLGSDFGTSWPALQKKFKQDETGLFFNERLEQEKEKRQKFTESRRQSRTKSDEDQVKIYLILDSDTNFFKIGSSVNPLRRFAEMCNQVNPAITISESRNFSLHWVSKICERNIEAVLHTKFKDKRVKGEWFSLNEDDLFFIKKTYGDTYVERTLQRTENENENSISLKKEKESENFSFIPSGFRPGVESMSLPISEIQIGKAQQYLKLTKQKDVSVETIIGLWEFFKAKEFNGIRYYNNVGEIHTHFFNGLKFEKLEENKQQQEKHNGNTVNDRLKAIKKPASAN